MNDSETIAALATAPGRAGIGVVRVSGSRCLHIAENMMGRIPEPRYALLTNFLDGQNQVIDRGIALYFRSPNSFTGEDVLEIQGHGGLAVLQLLLERCLELGARMAEPGEFTRRAFLNEKLDLAQAESVADLIDASTAAAAKSAMRSLSGEFSSHIHKLVKSLINLRLRVEATIDFPEEDIELLESSGFRVRIDKIEEELHALLLNAQQGILLRDGAQVVLIGQPNVGKSSLLNSLAGEDVAIVTDVAGTTRDPIRQHIQIEGVVFHIIDTAGLRDTSDTVESIGIDRTWASVGKADIAVLLVDIREGLNERDEAILEKLPSTIHILRVYNKIDTVGECARRVDREGETTLYLSAKTGDGLDLLRQCLLNLAGWRPSSEGIFMARQRHVSALQSAGEYLKAAKERVSQVEFMAEELRLAQLKLNQITGEFGADDLLGEIFSKFCIGK
ncbi:MAG: tRNA uridine-5-carboxymethylaminomethyl(34) synthesis GTPase MnmE [Sulfuricellaceae bacterium]|nr:tRNA uridine-5-carboxymethylaminomethyl(34) synthesis GTPase MnmE [Sulfuricellaceae bacterium]